eukprot:m51a1_g3816 hypothetical protein (170) ;mRNA; r:269307-270345
MSRPETGLTGPDSAGGSPAPRGVPSIEVDSVVYKGIPFQLVLSLPSSLMEASGIRQGDVVRASQRSFLVPANHRDGDALQCSRCTKGNRRLIEMRPLSSSTTVVEAQDTGTAGTCEDGVSSQTPEQRPAAIETPQVESMPVMDALRMLHRMQQEQLDRIAALKALLHSK